MSNENKFKYLAKNTVLFTICSFGSKLITFFLVPLYTKVLSTSEYGIADLITTSVMLCGYLFTLDIESAVLRFGIDKRENTASVLNFSLWIVLKGSIIFGVGVFVFSGLSNIGWPSYCYIYMFIYYFVSRVNGVLANYLRAVDKVKFVAIGGLIATAATIGSNLIFLLVFGLGLSGYLLSLTIGSVASTLYQVIAIDTPLKRIIQCKSEKTERTAMIKYSTPLIFNGVAWWINNSLDKYFITVLIGTAANGIYSIAYKIPTMMVMVQSVFNQAWNLSAIKEFDRNDSDGFFGKTYNTYNACLVVFSSLLIIFNKMIARFLFAYDFFEAWHYAPLLVVATLFSAMAGFIGSIFSAAKDSKIFAISTVSTAVINTIINSLLIPAMGIYGAAIGTLAAFILIWLIRLICSKRYICMQIHIFKDVLIYIILIIQAVCAIFFDSLIFVQLGLFNVIILAYIKELREMFQKLFKLSNYVKIV